MLSSSTLFQSNSWIMNILQFLALHQIDRKVQSVGIVKAILEAQNLILKFLQSLSMQQRDKDSQNTGRNNTYLENSCWKMKFLQLVTMQRVDKKPQKMESSILSPSLVVEFWTIFFYWQFRKGTKVLGVLESLTPVFFLLVEFTVFLKHWQCSK